MGKEFDDEFIDPLHYYTDAYHIIDEEMDKDISDPDRIKTNNIVSVVCVIISVIICLFLLSLGN